MKNGIVNNVSLFYSYELFESLLLTEQGFVRRGKTGDTEFRIGVAGTLVL